MLVTYPARPPQTKADKSDRGHASAMTSEQGRRTYIPIHGRQATCTRCGRSLLNVPQVQSSRTKVSATSPSMLLCGICAICSRQTTTAGREKSFPSRSTWRPVGSLLHVHILIAMSMPWSPHTASLPGQRWIWDTPSSTRSLASRSSSAMLNAATPSGSS